MKESLQRDWTHQLDPTCKFKTLSVKYLNCNGGGEERVKNFEVRCESSNKIRELQQKTKYF